MEESPIRVPGGSGDHGATTALIWIRHDNKVEDSIVYGTQAGYLVFWKEKWGKNNVCCFIDTKVKNAHETT